MIDISYVPLLSDIDKNPRVLNTEVYRVKNLITTQRGSLYYNKKLGVDLALFLQKGILFQNETFRAHLEDVMVNNGIYLNKTRSEINAFIQKFYFNITPNDSGELIGR